MHAPLLSARRAAAAVLLGVAALARAHAQSVVQAEPVIVADTPVSADAAGATLVRVPDSAPIRAGSFANVANTVANLHVNTGGAGSFGDLISLRGLTNTPYFSDPSVAVYFDDLPLGSVFTYPEALFGFSSATVLRGPQPAAYGRAAEGGVIAFTSPRPGATPKGEVRVGFGNYDARTAAVTAASAAGGTADATVAASQDERDGYITNTELGTRVDRQRDSSAAARVRVRPTATSEITFQLLASRRRDGAQPLVPLGGPLYTVARGREGATDSDFAGGALKLAFDTAFGRLSATTSRTSWSLNPYANRLVMPPTIDSRLTQSQRAWNEELRLASGADAATVWKIGAWFSDTETRGDANRELVGLFPIEVSHFALNSHTAAVFAQDAVAIGSRWRITAALRAEHVKRTFDRSQAVPGPGRFTDAGDFDALLPKLTATYALNGKTNASASVGVGTKPGGWSGYTDKAALARFGSERAVSFEAGVDTLLAGRTVKLAARVFDNEIRDYQIERSFNATDYLVVNAPRARAFGGELEAAWRPAPAWSFTASLGATDATLRTFTDPFTGISYAGHRAPYVPAYDAHLGATYHAASGWFATAEADAVGRTYFDESENVAFAARAHAVLDAIAGFETARWRVSVHAENLTDARYVTLMIPGVGHEVPGAPFTYGVEAALRW